MMLYASTKDKGTYTRQGMDLGSIHLSSHDSDQKTLKVGIHSFPAWHSALKG